VEEALPRLRRGDPRGTPSVAGNIWRLDVMSGDGRNESGLLAISVHL